MIFNPSSNAILGTGVDGLANLTFAQAEEKWQYAASNGTRTSMNGAVRQISGTDMNNDGVVDVVVAYGGGSNAGAAVSGVQVLFGSASTQSDGNFASVSPTNVSNTTHPVLAMQAFIRPTLGVSYSYCEYIRATLSCALAGGRCRRRRLGGHRVLVRQHRRRAAQGHLLRQAVGRRLGAL